MFYSDNPCRDAERHEAWLERQEALAQAQATAEFWRVQPILAQAILWREKAGPALAPEPGGEWTLLELLQDGMENEPFIDLLFSELMASDSAKALRTELAARWSEKIHPQSPIPTSIARHNAGFFFGDAP